MSTSESTVCPHGQLARQCLNCEQAAEIERRTPSRSVVARMIAEALDTVTQGYDRLLIENKQLQTEAKELRADTKTLRNAVVSAAHTLEQARIWDGMKWHWNINATACQRAWKTLDAALAAKEDT